MENETRYEVFKMIFPPAGLEYNYSSQKFMIKHFNRLEHSRLSVTTTAFKSPKKSYDQQTKVNRIIYTEHERLAFQAS